MLTPKEKKLLIEKFKRHDTDTGSENVQIGLITKRIERLQTHLKKHAKDFSSRRSLVMLVSKRRHLLNYLKKHNEKAYKKLKESLKI